MKIKLFILFMMMILTSYLFAQELDLPIKKSLDDAVENNLESDESNLNDGTAYLERLSYFREHPINLNNNENDINLQEIGLLDPLLIKSIVEYKNLLGSFISIYELQAIPSMNMEKIKELLPYVVVSENITSIDAVKKRFISGEHQLLCSVIQPGQLSKGYVSNTSNVAKPYEGSAQGLLIKYKYNYKNLLQYGVLMKKDPGESMFGKSQSIGFDFYSFHLFIKKMKFLKSLAIGDYTVNMGQGLVQWQSFAFKKGADVLQIKRQGEVLRPYSSSNEFNFHRGVGFTLGYKKIDLTFFGSHLKKDANSIMDSSSLNINYVSSFSYTGLHRTVAEIQDKENQLQNAFGGVIHFKSDRLYVGVNVINYHFKYPFQKSNYPYNLFAFNGSRLTNYSVDYAYTTKNIHFFGELAVSNNQHLALVNGLLASISKNVDVSMLYRNISKKYGTLYSNVFMESSTPINERGVYTAVSVRPAAGWQVDAYADFFVFPWIKYLVNAPSVGSDYLIKVTHVINKNSAMNICLKTSTKEVNVDPLEKGVSALTKQKKYNLRFQFDMNLNSKISVSNRVEAVSVLKNGASPEQGYLLYSNWDFKTGLKNMNLGGRIIFFESSSYESRIFAYENDLLQSFMVSNFNNSGVRYFVNLKYKCSKKLMILAKWSNSIYSDIATMGSGNDEITSNHRSEIKFQLLYKF